MTRWQRRARLVIAISAVVFAIIVVFALKRRDTRPSAASAPRADPGAVVEVTGGRVERFRLSREDVRVAYQRQLTYADGSTKLVGVTIAADARAGNRNFLVTANEGDVGQNESAIRLNGDVRLTASDGMTLRAENASYVDKDGLVHTTGPVEFSRGRMTGSGIGMTYDTVRDALVILDRAIVHVASDERGSGAAEVASGTATFSRPPSSPSAGSGRPELVRGSETSVRFDRDVKLRRAGQSIGADTVVAYLSPDEKQIQLMELRGRARLAMEKVAAGGLQELTGRDMDLKYGADGESLEHAVLMGDGAILLAGTAGAAGRQIRANTIDVGLAPDGATPTVMTARESVVLTLPAERTIPERTIESDAMDSKGEPGHGLTRAQFTGNVEYREKSASINREVSAAILEVALEPGMAGFRDAKFSRRVHFIDGQMRSDAAEALYDPGKGGLLELSGSEPAVVRPRLVNDRLAIDATRIVATLAGAHLKAVGAVKSVMQPAQRALGTSSAKTGPGGPTPTETRLPSMFKQDRPINVTADTLEYDGTAKRATYTGNVQLWQEETSLKGGTIVLDDITGDLAAGGNVTTVTVRDSLDESKKVERVRSIATASDFRYEEATRRATYTGNAHMNRSDGDITAAKIELYLKPSGSSGAAGAGGPGGDDLERAEAYESVTLRDQNRTTTGTRLTYTTADQRYVITGTPVKLLDECRRETIGRTLTYVKSVETLTIDGNAQTRTQTKGSAQCP